MFFFYNNVMNGKNKQFLNNTWLWGSLSMVSVKEVDMLENVEGMGNTHK